MDFFDVLGNKSGRISDRQKLNRKYRLRKGWNVYKSLVHNRTKGVVQLRQALGDVSEALKANADNSILTQNSKSFEDATESASQKCLPGPSKESSSSASFQLYRWTSNIFPKIRKKIKDRKRNCTEQKDEIWAKNHISKNLHSSKTYSKVNIKISHTSSSLHSPSFLEITPHISESFGSSLSMASEILQNRLSQMTTVRKRSVEGPIIEREQKPLVFYQQQVEQKNSSKYSIGVLVSPRRSFLCNVDRSRKYSSRESSGGSNYTMIPIRTRKHGFFCTMRHLFSRFRRDKSRHLESSDSSIRSKSCLPVTKSFREIAITPNIGIPSSRQLVDECTQTSSVCITKTQHVRGMDIKETSVQTTEEPSDVEINFQEVSENEKELATRNDIFSVLPESGSTFNLSGEIKEGKINRMFDKISIKNCGETEKMSESFAGNLMEYCPRNVRVASTFSAIELPNRSGSIPYVPYIFRPCMHKDLLMDYFHNITSIKGEEILNKKNVLNKSVGTITESFGEDSNTHSHTNGCEVFEETLEIERGREVKSDIVLPQKVRSYYTINIVGMKSSDNFVKYRKEVSSQTEESKKINLVNVGLQTSKEHTDFLDANKKNELLKYHLTLPVTSVFSQTSGRFLNGADKENEIKCLGYYAHLPHASTNDLKRNQKTYETESEEEQIFNQGMDSEFFNNLGSISESPSKVITHNMSRDSLIEQILGEERAMQSREYTRIRNRSQKIGNRKAELSNILSKCKNKQNYKQSSSFESDSNVSRCTWSIRSSINSEKNMSSTQEIRSEGQRLNSFVPVMVEKSTVMSTPYLPRSSTSFRSSNFLDVSINNEPLNLYHSTPVADMFNKTSGRILYGAGKEKEMQYLGYGHLPFTSCNDLKRKQNPYKTEGEKELLFDQEMASESVNNLDSISESPSNFITHDISHVLLIEQIPKENMVIQSTENTRVRHQPLKIENITAKLSNVLSNRKNKQHYRQYRTNMFETDSNASRYTRTIQSSISSEKNISSTQEILSEGQSVNSFVPVMEEKSTVMSTSYLPRSSRSLSSIKEKALFSRQYYNGNSTIGSNIANDVSIDGVSANRKYDSSFKMILQPKNVSETMISVSSNGLLRETKLLTSEYSIDLVDKKSHSSYTINSSVRPFTTSYIRYKMLNIPSSSYNSNENAMVPEINVDSSLPAYSIFRTHSGSRKSKMNTTSSYTHESQTQSGTTSTFCGNTDISLKTTLYSASVSSPMKILSRNNFPGDDNCNNNYEDSHYTSKFSKYEISDINMHCGDSVSRPDSLEINLGRKEKSEAIFNSSTCLVSSYQYSHSSYNIYQELGENASLRNQLVSHVLSEEADTEARGKLLRVSGGITGDNLVEFRRSISRHDQFQKNKLTDFCDCKKPNTRSTLVRSLRNGGSSHLNECKCEAKYLPADIVKRQTNSLENDNCLKSPFICLFETIGRYLPCFKKSSPVEYKNRPYEQNFHSHEVKSVNYRPTSSVTPKPTQHCNYGNENEHDLDPMDLSLVKQSRPSYNNDVCQRNVNSHKYKNPTMENYYAKKLKKNSLNKWKSSNYRSIKSVNESQPSFTCLKNYRGLRNDKRLMKITHLLTKSSSQPFDDLKIVPFESSRPGEYPSDWTGFTLGNTHGLLGTRNPINRNAFYCNVHGHFQNLKSNHSRKLHVSNSKKQAQGDFYRKNYKLKETVSNVKRKLKVKNISPDTYAVKYFGGTDKQLENKIYRINQTSSDDITKQYKYRKNRTPVKNSHRQKEVMRYRYRRDANKDVCTSSVSCIEKHNLHTSSQESFSVKDNLFYDVDAEMEHDIFFTESKLFESCVGKKNKVRENKRHIPDTHLTAYMSGQNESKRRKEIPFNEKRKIIQGSVHYMGKPTKENDHLKKDLKCFCRNNEKSNKNEVMFRESVKNETLKIQIRTQG